MSLDVEPQTDPISPYVASSSSAASSSAPPAAPPASSGCGLVVAVGHQAGVIIVLALLGFDLIVVEVCDLID